MRLDLGPRLHAFAHSLLRPTETAETERVYRSVSLLAAQHGQHTSEGRERFAATITETVGAIFELPASHPQRAVIANLVRQLLRYERLFQIPTIDLCEPLTVAEHWEVRKQLGKAKKHLERIEEVETALALTVARSLAPLFEAASSLMGDLDDEDAIHCRCPLPHALSRPGQVLEAMLPAAFSEEATELGLFERLRLQLDRNLILASGGNPDDPGGFKRAPKLPSAADAKDPEALIGSYVGRTPLVELFAQDVSVSIPLKTRFEHHHIIAGSGHGKTQTLQFLIGSDLEAVARGERSVVVLDSQGDLIRTVSSLQAFAPGEPLHERLVLIDPTDVEWPVSLNLFDVGVERMAGYEPLERERLQNSILELYDFVLGTLLSAEMTQKQSVIFRYVTRLMLHIPDATIHTLRELMEPGSEKVFAEHIAKLGGTARRFFETEFTSKEFEQTKKQVLRRLWGILENQTFERMFSHPRSKLDLFSEMNTGKVILINTAKDLLKETGTEIFGRFFIALIAQAAQERATMPEKKRLPAIVYVDEAADYFDRNIGVILSQARKYNVGMVLAHQYLGQLEPRLQDAFAANTSIKFAGGVSAKDAKALAPMLHCDPALIERQPKGGFAAYIRGSHPGALPLSFPFGYLEGRPQMSEAERRQLRERMRERYAVHHTELDGGSAAALPEKQATGEVADPTAASETW